MKNKLDLLFENKKENVLNVYCTAGYPAVDSTATILQALQQSGADIIELGMPYSDPIADGPVIQNSNMAAIQNGMTIELLMQQLAEVKSKMHIPIILMGYLNPVLQYGFEKFCKQAAAVGISGLILPDMPMPEYNQLYKKIFEKYQLHPIFLITPQTSDERIKKADKLSKGFVYAVSSASTTGNNNAAGGQQAYFEKLQKMKFKNPVLIGFGIHDNHSFINACKYANGAIIGSAFINKLSHSTDVTQTTADFVKAILAPVPSVEAALVQH